jgi:hypothetical protein
MVQLARAPAGLKDDAEIAPHDSLAPWGEPASARRNAPSSDRARFARGTPDASWRDQES